MLQRQSSLFIPTLRDAPVRRRGHLHKLLVRGGYIRQVGAGIWTFLPLGWKVHQNVVQIVREEIDAIGGQEMLCPVLTPFELWQQTGRDYIQEIFRLKDRNGRDFVLPLTHEETFALPRARAPELPPAPADPLPLRGEAARRAAPARGAAPRPRVHHEGLVLVRS